MFNCFNVGNKSRSNSPGCSCSCHDGYTRKEQIIQKANSVSQSNTQNWKKFTQGPLDGSLYATVDKQYLNQVNLQENCNLNTTSIDSGICSSIGENHNYGQITKNKHCSNAKTKINQKEIEILHDKENKEEDQKVLKESTNQNIKKESNSVKSIQDTELDDLVNEMLLDLESIPDFPDLKKNHKMSIQQETKIDNSNKIKTICGGGRSPELEIEQPISPRFIKKPFLNDFVDKQVNTISKSNQIVANASTIGQPFTYGVPMTSPAIQRRRLHSEKTAYISESKPDSDTIDQDSEENLIELLRKEALQDNFNYPTNQIYNSSIISDGSIINGSEDLSWLQKQKLKLKNRKEGEILQDKANKERNLLAELRGVVRPRDDSNQSPNMILRNNYSEPLYIDTANEFQSKPNHHLIQENHENEYQSKFNQHPIEKNHENEFLTVHTKKKILPKSPIQKKEVYSLKENLVPIKKETPNEQKSKKMSEPDRSNSPLYGSIQTPKKAATNLPISYNTTSEQASPKSYVHEDELKDLIQPSPFYSNSRPSSKYSIYQSTPIRNICDLPDCNNPRIANPCWSPIGGCYLKSNYPDERSTTPCFTIPTPTYSRTSKTSSPTPTPSVFPETYLKIKKQQEQDLTGDVYKCLTNSFFNNSMNENNNLAINEDIKSVYLNQSQRSSAISISDSELICTSPTFVKDTSTFWYRPNISREEAIKILLNKPPGSFIVRDSDSFKGAFGLAIRVSEVTPEMQIRSNGESNLVRHYLIQSTTKGVRIKGCPNEPVFGSLSALIFQHTTMQLALPCKLVLPEEQDTNNLSLTEPEFANKLQQQRLLQNGAACNVLYLVTINTESLTGPEAIKKTVSLFFNYINHYNKSSNSSPKLIPYSKNFISFKDEQLTDINTDRTVVYFKVSSKGISMTDNMHRKFFRKHFTIQSISYCGLDPENRKFTPFNSTNKSSFFGFVSREIKNQSYNHCHLFADLEQPAAAIVSFINKIFVISKD